jgi:ABC-type Na+ efflux pump permease subunit
VVPSTSTNLVIQPRFILTTTSSSGTTNTANLFSSNSTYSATPINLKNINSKLNETLSKTKIVDTKNFIKTTIVPQQQRSATTIVNSNLIESKLAIEEAQSSLLEFKNNLITQSHNLNSIITSSSSSQQQRPTITQSPTTVIVTTVTTPTTTISTNSFSNTNSSTPSPVQQPIFNLIQNPSSSKPNIIRKTKSKTDM